MKLVTLLSVIVCSGVANAAQTHNVTLSEYLFRGTLLDMTGLLQEKLAEEIVTTCATSTGIRMSNLSISFKRGKLAGTGPLDVDIVTVNEKPLIDFPSHPKAEITASFECP